VDNSTTAVLRHPDRTLTSAAGSFLLERLASRTRNFTAAKCRLRSLASGCKLRNNYLVNQWNIGLNIENRSWKVY
jgi:hypothetical protein